jgi:hypothetical protein
LGSDGAVSEQGSYDELKNLEKVAPGIAAPAYATEKSNPTLATQEAKSTARKLKKTQSSVPGIDLQKVGDLRAYSVY